VLRSLPITQGLPAGPRGSEQFWFIEGYAVIHFNDEERLMLRLSFPALVTFRVQHHAFAVEIGKLKERLRIEGARPGLTATT